jgi:hypothetical protein
MAGQHALSRIDATNNTKLADVIIVNKGIDRSTTDGTGAEKTGTAAEAARARRVILYPCIVVDQQGCVVGLGASVRGERQDLGWSVCKKSDRAVMS